MICSPGKSGSLRGRRTSPANLSKFMLGAALVIISAVGGLMFMIRMPGKSYSGQLPPPTPVEREISSGLQRHVQFLAGEIGQRNIWNPPSMATAAGYIERTFALAGYPVRRQKHLAYRQETYNLEAELPGHTDPGGIIVIGAHYDSVLGSPGANDNASGVAVLLELARLLQQAQFRHTVRFVAFTNEEAPFYFSDEMGSRLYARRSRERKENLLAMISLETVGYYSDQPNSQQYPFPFRHFYPDEANFIAFVGNTASRGLVRRSIAAFRRNGGIPSEGVAAPGIIRGVGWSDHWSFWKSGYQAIMVTDTAFFRYAHYHTEEDTPDRLDYHRMALLVQGLKEVAAELAGGNLP